jgi:ABC-type branched-subunit amino acid transport system substrate-binding protein
MSRIFISYRRSDSITITGRIHDRLVIEFSDDAVFKDVDDIPLGADFRTVLDHEVGRCAVQLVIIGPEWLNAVDPSGQRRLDDPDDFVRIEVEAGLRRDEVLVIPVLVKGAGMPSSADLPPSLRELVFRNAAIIRDDPDFHRDMSRLIHQINQHIDPSQAPAVVPPPPEPVKTTPPKQSPRSTPAKAPPKTKRPTGRSLPRVGAAAALVVVAVFALLIVIGLIDGNDGDNSGGSEWDGTGEGMVVVSEGVDPLIAVALDAENPDDSLDIARGVELAHHLRDMMYIDESEIPWDLYELESPCSDESLGLAEAFVGDTQVIGVVGHACNDACFNTISIYAEAGYTTISPACGDPELARSDEYPSFLRTVPPAIPPEVVVADFVFNYLDRHTIATIHGASEPSVAQVQEFARHFNEMGGEVVSLAIGSEEDVWPTLNRLSDEEVQSVYFAGDVQYAAMLLSFNDLFRAHGIALILADGNQKHEFVQFLDGDPGIDVFAIYPEMPDWQDAPPDWLASFEEFHGSPPQSIYAISAFAATNMFLDAVEELGEITGDGTLWVSRDALRDFLHNYEADSPVGYLNCSGGNGNCLPVPVIIYKLGEGGTYSEVDFR